MDERDGMLPEGWRGGLTALGIAGLVSAVVVQDRSRKAESENPPLGKFVEFGGVRLHYVERGRGEPLVLLHGNVVTGLDFLLSGLVAQAAKRYRVIVFDRPGYGWSTRPRGSGPWGPRAQAAAIRGAMARIGAERAVVLGHSWGSLVAMAMALDHPDAVRGLVLESGYYYPTARLDALLAAPPALPVIGDLMRFTVSPLLSRASWPLMARAMFSPAPVTPGFRRFPPWLAFRPSQLRTIAAEAAETVPAAASLAPRYPELAVPTMILAGRDDRVVDFEAQSLRLARALPEAELRVFHQLGHMLHHSAPGSVLAAIDRVAGGGVAQPRAAALARA